jgi:hypothetical protein
MRVLTKFYDYTMLKVICFLEKNRAQVKGT